MEKKRAEYLKKYYEKNRERITAKRRANYEKNKEHYRQYRAAYRETLTSKKKYLGAFIDKDLAEALQEKLTKNELSYTDFLVLSIRKYIGK
jgi:hypothetical protein